MQRKELERVAEKHVGQIKKYADQIPGSFGAEDIHELRVDYKKLRAFLRLLHPGKSTHDAGIPHKLKELYHTAGSVRDLQVFLTQLTASAENQLLVPQYIKLLEHQLFNNKEKLVKEIESADVDDMRATIKQHLPSQMKDSIIRKFIHRKVAAIHIILLDLGKSKNLHTVRKHLKDILYNIRTFQHNWGISFPVVAWKSEKFLTDITSRLGDFNDECTALQILNSHYNRELPAQEISILEEWRHQRLQKREEHKRQLVLQVKSLQLVHNFK